MGKHRESGALVRDSKYPISTFEVRHKCRHVRPNKIKIFRGLGRDFSTTTLSRSSPVPSVGGWVMGAVDIYFRRAAVTVAFSNVNEGTFLNSKGLYGTPCVPGS